MIGRRRKGEDGGDSAGGVTRVADECEAFLSGRLALHLMATGQLVPTWIGINRLAHGTVDDVLALGTRSDANVRASEWSVAVAYLADLALDLTGDDPGRLRDLQRDVLVPAELDLASDWFRPREPSDAVTAVLARLEGRRSDGTTRT
jgi:hypothetical protein